MIQNEIIEVGSGKQLFVDSKFVASSAGVDLVMNPPYQADEPVLMPDQTWERRPGASYGIYSSILKDADGRIRAWYHVRIGDYRSGKDEAHVAYAESDDGVHFTKPVLDLFESNGTTQNNVVIPGDIGGSSVWIDPHAPPEVRYKNQAKVYSPPEVWGHLHMHGSPDGIHWKLLRDVELSRGGWDTQTIVFWDPPVRRYVMYTRHWFAKRHGTAGGNINYRTVRRLESDDLLEWGNQRIVMRPDDVDMDTYETPFPLRPEGPERPYGRVPVDYYGASVFKYPDPEGVYVMLANANWYWYDREPIVTVMRDDMGVAREETQNIYGPSRFDARLSVSRDGVNFQRCGGRKAFLTPGKEGSFSSRMVWATPSPVPMGDELWIYYSGTNRDHDGVVDPSAGRHLSGIGRAVMRLDGFVSADADYGGGELVTPAIRFEGAQLELNLDTGGGGSVKVELQDHQGRPLTNYTESDASFLCGNSVRMPVRWGERTKVGELSGRPIRIRFVMRDCKLYAFQFTSSG